MKITKIVKQKKRENYYSIYVDGKYSFSISDENLLRLKLKEDKEINPGELNHIVREEEKYGAMDSALRLLAIRSRSAGELESRLLRKRYSGPAIQYVIERLRNLGYLNDTQFARDWASYLMQKGKGIRLIRSELRRKGIEPETITNVLEDYNELSEKEVERVTGLARQKLKLLHHLPAPVIVRRLYGYLARRGFSPELIEQVLRELKQQASQEND